MRLRTTEGTLYHPEIMRLRKLSGTPFCFNQVVIRTSRDSSDAEPGELGVAVMAPRAPALALAASSRESSPPLRRDQYSGRLSPGGSSEVDGRNGAGAPKVRTAALSETSIGMLMIKVLDERKEGTTLSIC